jgi:glycosyltransferase involved in cell wall biosynthesis
MDDPTQPLVSIVTPVFNGADYLAECIESVLAQTHRNWEYTIVNNCSTDDSLAIAQSYAARDSRIRVHNNSAFLRVIPNHNLALRQISPASKYCKMIFADDWMFSECVERMVAVAEEHPSVGIVGAYGLQGSKIVCAGLPYPSTVISGRELGRRQLLGNPSLYVFGTPTSLLFRSELVRSQDPFFNECNLHADSEKCYELLTKCDFGFVHQVLTFVRERPESLSSFSARLNTVQAGVLHAVLTYGPDYLSQEEFQRVRRESIAWYYRFLAANAVLWRRDEEFWRFHKRKLTEAGVGYSRTRLAKAVLVRLVDVALNPKRSIERMFELRAG